MITTREKLSAGRRLVFIKISLMPFIGDKWLILPFIRRKVHFVRFLPILISKLMSRGNLMMTNARKHAGMTVIELLLVMVIMGILTAVAVPAYNNYTDRIRVSNAITDIMTIQVMIDQFFNDTGAWPDSLADIGVDWDDPYGNPYGYLRIDGGPPGSEGLQRKDHNLVPVNSDYDLYSSGKDGGSQPAFSSQQSRDDIVRAQNGAYMGLASEY